MYISTVPAQTHASITGFVVDSKGALVAQATIAVHSPGNKITRCAVADGSGRFALANVPAGTCVLDADTPGFATTHEAGQTLATGQPNDLSVVLRIGNLEQMVEVQADASNSVAAQLAPMDARLDAPSAHRDHFALHRERNRARRRQHRDDLLRPPHFLREPNGSGLGDSRNFFRGFSAGNYNITFDGIPYEDTNSPPTIPGSSRSLNRQHRL